MKKNVLCIVAIGLACSAHAQPTFMKIFNGVGTAKGNLNELSSGNLRIGMARQSGTSLIDPEGNILQSHCYVIDTLLAVQSVKMYSDNEFYFAATYWKDTCSFTGTSMNYPVIGRMDSLGNIVALCYYSLNAPVCSNRGGDLEVMTDKNLIVWGKGARMFVLKTDSTLVPQWAKRFSNNGGFQFIKELPGGDLLAGINMDTAGAVVARMDADGNFLWVKSYIRPSGMVHDAVIESDDAFIITGFTDSTASTNVFVPYPPTYHPKLFMMKLDGEGEVLWCKGYDSAPNLWYSRRASNLVRTLDGNYAVLATLGEPNYHWIYRPLLMKTDQNGDTLWTRSVGVNNYAYETQSLLAYSDGGFMFNGQIWGDLPEGQANFAFLYKTDSLGHLPCHEQYHPVQVLDLFPVDSSFTLTSVDGAVALPAFAQDTTYAPLVMYEACEVVTGISPIRHYRSMRVYPNPTPGRFTMEFSDPLLRESYYSVYDATGRLLYQRPLPTGAKLEEVDLSRLGRGTYLLRVTDPEGHRHERVVVE
jgi:hypothetical protein